MNENVLELKNLKVVFPTMRGFVRAVESVDLSIREGECLALVGESGCGKSVTSLAAMKLLDPAASVVRADVHRLCGKDIRNISSNEIEQIRGKDAAMIFQDALSALNPVMTVGRQIDEIFFRHMKISKEDARKRSIEALAKVGVPDPEARYRSFPHELSGGMRQRVLIAMAFACNPKLIIADEPTTALDVTIQAQVLDVLSGMQKDYHTALLLISHDMSVVSFMADRIAVMYSGRIVEMAQRDELFARPLHPYTQGLLSSVVQINDEKTRFVQIEGNLPDPVHKPEGCYFHPRCRFATDVCRHNRPMPVMRSEGHMVRCHREVSDE